MSEPTGREPALPQDTHLTGREPFVSGKEWVVEPLQWREIYDDALQMINNLEAFTMQSPEEAHGEVCITEPQLLELAGRKFGQLASVWISSRTSDEDNFVTFRFYGINPGARPVDFTLSLQEEEVEFRGNIVQYRAWQGAREVIAALQEWPSMRDRVAQLHDWRNQIARHPRLEETEHKQGGVSLLDEQLEYLETMLKTRGMLGGEENLLGASVWTDQVGENVISPEMFLEFSYLYREPAFEDCVVSVQIRYFSSFQAASHSLVLVADPRLQAGLESNERLFRHRRNDFTRHPMQVMTEVMRVLGEEGGS